MKRKGRHPSDALTGMFVQAVTAPGFYADGNGLYLRVDHAGAKRWILRTMVQGKRRDVGLGGCSSTSLVEARARARMLRKIAREGGDPLAVREQVCKTLHPEVTQAVNETLELLRKAGVRIDDVILGKLRVANERCVAGHKGPATRRDRRYEVVTRSRVNRLGP